MSDSSATAVLGRVERFAVADRLERIPITSSHRLILGLLLTSWFCEAIDLGGTSFMLPVISKYWAFSAVQGGYYASIAFFGMLVGSVAAGFLSDKYGRKPLIVACMITWGIGGLALSASTTIPMLFLCRFILGIGLGAQLPVAVSYLSEFVASRARSKYLAFYQMLLPAGLATAGVITMLVLPVWGWRGCYIIEALPSLLFILILKLCPESPMWLEMKGRHAEADVIIARLEQRAVVTTDKPLGEVIARPRSSVEIKGTTSDLFRGHNLKILFMLLIASGFMMMADYGLTTWLTKLLMAKGFDIIRSTGFVTVGIVGGIPAFFFAAWAVERIGRKWSILISSVTAAVFAYLYGASSSIAMLIVLGVLYQFGKYSLAMTTTIYGPELWYTHLRATGQGLSGAFGRLGAIIGPIVLAAVMSSSGDQAVFYVAAGMTVVTGLAVMLLGPETKGKSF